VPQLCDNGGGSITITGGGSVPAPKTCAGNPTKTCADDVDCVDPQGTTGPCGNGNEPGQCRGNCVPPACGDGITDPGEGCDDGNTVVANCDPAKTTCGGGTDTCGTAANACANPSCGDGVTEAPEQCDAGANNGKAGNNTNVGVGGGADCTTACQFNVCGDKSVQDAEQCDDGNTNPFDDCNACVNNVCGDGVTDATGPKNIEQCDDHNTGAEDGCFECCLEAGSVTGNLPTEFAAKACLLNKLSAGVSGLQIKNRKTASTLVKTMSKTLQLEATAQGIDPNGNKGKNRNQICSLERRVRRLLINVQKGISKGVLSGNVNNATGSELVIKAEDASQWATQISSELLCTPR
jgi:cysteine-rich repeat protein